MRLLRVLLAGLITVTALVAGFFAAAVILFTGVAAYLLQLFWRPRPPAQRSPAQETNRPSPLRTDDVIDVVATKVPTDSSKN